MARTLLPVALAILALAPRVAWADSVSDAKDLFERARELRTHGDCPGAVPVFRKAYALYPEGLGSLRNVAECEESLGRFASARRAWLELKRALVTHQDPKYAGWSQDAEESAARLVSRVATLTIDLQVVGGSGEGLRVSLDGEALPSSLVGTALDRDPGRHVVQVGGDRVNAQERTVDLSAGDAKQVSLRVERAARADDAPVKPDGPPPPPTEDDGERRGATRRTVSWAVIGVGAASLVGAGVSLGVRQAALGDLDGSCPSQHGCPSSVKGDVSRGQTASTLVTALGVTGAVALTAGVVLLLTGPRGEPRAGLVVTPTIGGASATWRF